MPRPTGRSEPGGSCGAATGRSHLRNEYSICEGINPAIEAVLRIRFILDFRIRPYQNQ